MKKKRFCVAMLAAVMLVVSVIPSVAYSQDQESLVSMQEMSALTEMELDSETVVAESDVPINPANESVSDSEKTNGSDVSETKVDLGIKTTSDSGIIDSGTCGDNLEWVLTADGTLTISGNGEMQNYNFHGRNAPWYNKKDSILSVVIENGVTSIGHAAFRYCRNITNINIPESVTNIGSSAFHGCSSLTNIEIPESVTNIGSSAFQSCSSLTSIAIPSGVTSIESGVFEFCYSLTSIEIPNSVTSIGEYAFWDCRSLASIKIPDGVTNISPCTFLGCSSLTNIEIPDGVTNISSRAFEECSSLVSIEIPERVTSIEHGAFKDCSNLTSIEIPESVTSISGSTFWGCSNLTSIEIPESVTSIGSRAFYGCSSLTNIEIPNGVTSIESSVFERCSSLTSIEIPESVTSIGNYAFYECSSLTSIKIPGSVTSIGDYTFCDCGSLISIEIPKSVTSIADYAFRRCSNLTDVYYGGNEQEWSEIEIGSYNSELTEATIHFNSTLDDEALIQDISVNENEVYGVCNSSCRLSGTYTASNPDTIKEELEKIEFNIQNPEIAEIADFSYLLSVDRKEASWYLNLNCKNVEDTILDISIPDSDIEGLSIPIYVEPELILPDDNVDFVDDYDVHLKLDQNTGDEIKVTAKLNNADSNYLNDFAKNVQCIIEKTPTSLNEYLPDISTEYMISDDGLELTYVITVNMDLLDEFDNIITISTQAQKKTIRIIKEKEDYFVLDRDTNAFPHWPEYFTGGDTTGLIGQGYTTSLYYYGKLVAGLSSTESAELLSFMNNKWGGSCHGIAVSMGLANLGLLNVGLLPMIDSESHNYSGLAWPNTNIPLRNIINYYQLLQEVGKAGEPVRKIENLSGKIEGTDWMEASEIGIFLDELCKIAKQADQNKTPLLLGFGYDKGKQKAGHTVLTCGYEETYSYNIIKIYDCNVVGGDFAKYSYLFIDKFSDNFYLSSTENIITPIDSYITNDNWNYIQFYNMDIWNIFNTEVEDIEKSSNTNALSLHSSRYSSNLFSFTVDTGKAFKITDSVGNYLQCVDGKIEGNLQVYDFEILGDNGRYKFILDNSDYIITNFDDETRFGFESADRYYAITPNGADNIEVYKDKGIELSGENVSFTTDVSVMGEVALLRLEGENTGNISITNDEEGINIDADTTNGSVNVSKINEEGITEKESYNDLNDLQLDNEGEKIEAHNHSYGAPEFVWSEDYQTCTTVFTCESCDDVQEIHCAITSETTKPTCTEAGKTVYTATASFADKEYTDIREEVILATGHTYEYTDNGDGTHTKACTAGDDTVTEPHTYQDGRCSFCGAEEPAGHIHNYGEPKFTWSDDYSSCTAVFTCADGDDQKAIECTVTSVNNADGSVSYTAVAEFNGESYTMQQTVAAKEEPEEGNPTGSGNNNNSGSSTNTNNGSSEGKASEAVTSDVYTGDDSNLVLWSSLLISMFSVAIIMLLIRKKKRL